MFTVLVPRVINFIEIQVSAAADNKGFVVTTKRAKLLKAFISKGSDGSYTLLEVIGTLSKKNYGIIWEFSQVADPPPSPPFGNPLFEKNFIVYFAF